jgi:hypothetical protein
MAHSTDKINGSYFLKVCNLPISGDKYKFEGWNKGCDIKKREKRKKK